MVEFQEAVVEDGTVRRRDAMNTENTENTENTTYDVVVVGGGSAGISAAIGASRVGARVALVEQYGFLGGAATNGSVLTHCGFFDQTRTQVVKGVGQQMLDRLDAESLYRTHTLPETGNTVVLLDLETVKATYDQLVAEAGVDVFLHTRLIAASTSVGTDCRITSVEVIHRGGRVVLDAAAFVDASGDGELIAVSGSGALVSPVEERQASTLVMRVGNVPEDASLSQKDMERAVTAYRDEHSTDIVRASGIAVRMPVSREVMLLLADQHRDVLEVRELTAAEMAARRAAAEYIEAFRAGMPGWDHAFLAATGPQLGIRESRRLRGRDAVTADDVSAARKREDDGIARCGWPMENHVSPGVTEYGGIADKGWYGIPYGAICSATTENLWAGGRLTSSDERAYASLRVMGTSFATGHAAGVAAAVYANGNAHDLVRTRAELERQGALL